MNEIPNVFIANMRNYLQKSCVFCFVIQKNYNFFYFFICNTKIFYSALLLNFLPMLQKGI